MRVALLHEHEALRTFAMVLENGDEAMASLVRLATERRLKATQFTAIGAFARLVVAYFDWESKEYRPIPINEQVEVLSLIGDISAENGKPRVHSHVVVGKADGTAHGGHLIEGQCTANARDRPHRDAAAPATPLRSRLWP